MIRITDHVAQGRPMVVIGGGVVGLCCAYYLQHAGIPAVLVEASNVGSGASSANLGLLAASHSLPLAAPGVVRHALHWLFQPNSPFSIELPPSSDTLRWLWQFIRASHSRHFPERAALLSALCLESIELFEELSRTFHFHLEAKGTLEVFSSAQGFQEFRQQLPVMKATGIQVDLIDKAYVLSLAPFLTGTFSGGALYSSDSSVNPQVFSASVRSQLGLMGAVVRENATVVRLRTESDRIAYVDFDDQSFAVAGVVLATGFQANALLRPLGLCVPIQAARGYTLDFPFLDHWPEMSIMFAEARLLSTSLGDRRRLGGYLHLVNSNSRNDHNISREALMAPLSAYVGAREIEELRRKASPVWSGCRPCSPDGLPVVGATKRYPNLFLALGHGMLGLTLAPITGKMIAQMAQSEETAASHDLLALDRF